MAEAKFSISWDEWESKSRKYYIAIIIHTIFPDFSATLDIPLACAPGDELFMYMDGFEEPEPNGHLPDQDNILNAEFGSDSEDDEDYDELEVE